MVLLRRHYFNKSFFFALLLATTAATILLLEFYANTGEVATAVTSNVADIGSIDSVAKEVTSLRRSHCQIIYVLGVEGSLHHGFMPIIKALADQQVDPITGSKFHVVKGHDVLRATIFGSKNTAHLPINDPQLVRETLDAICPPNNSYLLGKNDYGILQNHRHHIIIEGNSFPSGGSEDSIINLSFRVRRQKDWQTMTPEDIASSPQALNHPTNLYEFYNAFSPHVDVRFVVLHRPYLETIASHAGFDSGPIQHSTVISGFLLLLSRFLVSHKYGTSLIAIDDNTGSDGVPLWTIICVEQLSSKEHDKQEQLLKAREQIVRSLASFLGWPEKTCPKCFDNWRESSKPSPELRLGVETTNIILSDHIQMLEGIWPPRRIEDTLPQQQCRI